MKRFIVPALVLAVLCCFSFLGCIKNRPYVTASSPTMTADIVSYKFVSSAVRPSTIDTQNYDTSTSLVITGYASDRANPYDKIVLVIANYKGVTGTFSIVQGQAHAAYYHGNSIGKGLGGIVAVNNVSTTVTSGYFSFNTDDGIAITSGKFVVNNP